MLIAPGEASRGFFCYQPPARAGSYQRYQLPFRIAGSPCLVPRRRAHSPVAIRQECGFVAADNTDVLQGTLDLLILKAVSLEAMHGWGISQRIRQFSSGVLEVNQGSLYPALHRLVKRRWLAASWGISENNRRARFYTLTTLGKRQLADETETWRRFSAAVDAVLATVAT